MIIARNNQVIYVYQDIKLHIAPRESEKGVIRVGL